VTRERRRFQRERLRRPRLLAGNVARRDRTLLDAEHRLPGRAVEHEDESHLGDLDHDGSRATCVRDVSQNRLRRRVEVPQIVVHQLRVPPPVTGCRIQRDQRVAEQILSRAIATEEVVRG
jgi:hypothetical protein